MNEKPGKHRRILDNRIAAVCNYLQENLVDADSFRLVSAYFSIYGYDLLAEELNAVRQVCFLFGDATSIKDPDPVAKESQSFAFTGETRQEKRLRLCRSEKAAEPKPGGSDQSASEEVILVGGRLLPAFVKPPAFSTLLR